MFRMKITNVLKEHDKRLNNIKDLQISGVTEKDYIKVSLFWSQKSFKVKIVTPKDAGTSTL